MVVAIKDKIEVYNILNLHKVSTISKECSIAKYALSSSADKCFLALTRSEEKGDIAIYDLLASNKKTEILAHQYPIKIMAFSSSGLTIATASSKVSSIKLQSIFRDLLFASFQVLPGKR